MHPALVGPLVESATGPLLRDNWLWHRAWCVGWIEALQIMLKLCTVYDFKLEEAVYWQMHRARGVQERIEVETGDGGDGELKH